MSNDRRRLSSTPPTPPTPPTPRSSSALPGGGVPRWRGWVLNILLVVLVFAGVHWWKARPLATGAAPPLAGIALDERLVDLVQMRGQPVLVHFWASWCPMCRVMEGAVAAVASDHQVITVGMLSGGPDELRALMQETGHLFRVVPDPEGRIAARWGVAGVPTTFVLDAAGHIHSSTVGVSTEPGLRARLWLAGRAVDDEERALYGLR